MSREPPWHAIRSLKHVIAALEAAIQGPTFYRRNKRLWMAGSRAAME